MPIHKHQSFWRKNLPSSLRFSPLSAPVETEVCVIGGGITGLTTAYLLCREGLHVTLLEADRIGSGTTGATTAHLDPLTDLHLSELIEKFGLTQAQEVIDSGMKAIDFIESTIDRLQFSADFKRVSGNYYSEKNEDKERLHQEWKAAKDLGLSAQLKENPPLPWPAQVIMEVKGLGQLDPLKYLYGLMEECLSTGRLQIFEQTRVVDIDSGSTCRVLTETVHDLHHEVQAHAVIMATHLPLGRMVSLQTRAFPYRSYVLGLRLAQQIPQGLYWDLEEPYHYLRQVEDERGPLLLVGGVDHKTGALSDTKKQYEELEHFARSRMLVGTVDYSWSSQYYESADGLPYIGEAPFERNVYVATGFGGTGLTFGTTAAMMISNDVLGLEVPWQKLYTPSRVRPLVSAKKFIQENSNVAGHLIKDFFKAAPEAHEEMASLKRRDGKILSMNGEKYAVYRDEKNQLHILSAVCTHFKCQVNWNNAEKSWDCPCHGGRYHPNGEVMCGPPVTGLKPFLWEEESHEEKAS